MPVEEELEMAVDDSMAIYANQYPGDEAHIAPPEIIDGADDIPFMDDESVDDGQEEQPKTHVMEKLDETLNWIAAITREVERALSPKAPGSVAVLTPKTSEETDDPSSESTDATSIQVDLVDESTLDVSTVEDSTYGTVDSTIRDVTTIETGEY